MNGRPALTRNILCASALALGACAGPRAALPDPSLLSRDRWILAAPGITLVRQLGRTDCGSAALAMVIGHHDPTASPAQVREWVGSVDAVSGIPAGRLRGVAQSRGLDAFLIEGTMEDLEHELRQGRPVLVGVRRVAGVLGFAHFAVVAGIDPIDQLVLMADPSEGWSEQSFADFEEHWRPSRNLALVVMPKGASPAR
jgi:ABC-type bacteriocin/lantibiotic exporter with double-glycine peptidase domain